MAIIPWLKGLAVTIKVDGETAKEYDPPEPESAPEDMKFHKLDQHLQHDDPFVVQYIEVKPSARFAFRMKRSPEFQYYGGHQIGFKVNVDGQQHSKVQIETHARSKTHQRSTTSTKMTGLREGNDAEGWTKRRFRFSALNIVEDEVPSADIKEQILQAQELGYLRVYCYRMAKSQVAPSSQRNRADVPRLTLKTTTTISEKALKGRALDCKVSLGEAGPARRPRSYYTINYDDDERRPFAVFEFRYRTLEGLYQEGIVPRPQVYADRSPVPEAGATPVGEVNAFSINNIIDVDEKEPQIKPENPDGGRMDDAIDVDQIPHIKPESSRGIKRERGDIMDTDATFLARYKGRRLPNGRIEIDLTED